MPPMPTAPVDYRAIVAYAMRHVKWTKHEQTVLEHGWNDSEQDLTGRISRALSWQGHTEETSYPLRQALAVLNRLRSAGNGTPVSNPTILDAEGSRAFVKLDGWTTTSIALECLASMIPPSMWNDAAAAKAHLEQGFRYLSDHSPIPLAYYADPL